MAAVALGSSFSGLAGQKVSEKSLTFFYSVGIIFSGLVCENFTYNDLDPGDSRNPMMCRWNSEITSDCDQ